jgi:hypothetical protein
MFSDALIYLFCVRVALALQIPRQATVSYMNTSASAVLSASTTPGPLCCEVYALGVALNHWYPGVERVVDSIVVTNFLRYNSTFSQITIPRVNAGYIFSSKTNPVGSCQTGSVSARSHVTASQRMHADYTLY